VSESDGRRSTVEIRSYRTVFELERRLYRIDRLRLPPGGIPMRGALYCLGLIAMAIVASALPGVRWLASMLPWYVRDLAAPITVAALLALLRIEGRPFHLAVRALLSHRLGPRWWSGLRPASRPGALWRPPDLLMLPDGSEGRWRAFDFHGPGAVMVRDGHECRERRGGPIAAAAHRPHVTLRERHGARQLDRSVVVLAAGARLRIRPARRRRAWRAEAEHR
jgi:hypothetical protein